MNWFNRIPNSRRSASGLEWRVWRKLPQIGLLGTALPLLVLLLLTVTLQEQADGAGQRWLQLARYVVLAVVLFHWTMVLTVAIGCVIVMIMKGPGYVADAYPVSHSDQPRQTQQSDEEALRNHPTALKP